MKCKIILGISLGFIVVHWILFETLLLGSGTLQLVETTSYLQVRKKNIAPEDARLEQDPYFQVVLGDEKFAKPTVTNKNYTFARLRNGLEVFLVSQVNTTVSSGKLGVKVGSGVEPTFLPGLANLLKSLLLINSEKYPEPDGFRKFIYGKNGHLFTHVSDIDTFFEFEVECTSFEEALSRFSEYFKTPLFEATSIEKKLVDLDRKFAIASLSDNLRSLHVLKELSDKKSVFHKFTYGNMETLKNIPESVGINIREEAMKFYEKEYSSNRMVLVLTSNHSLEELKELALKYFSGIKNKGLPVPSGLVPIYDFPNPLTSILNRIVLIDSLSFMHVHLSLIFPMKRYMSQYSNYMRTFLLERLISSKRHGSLHNFLLSNGVIISSSVEMVDRKIGFSFLEIKFSLTNKGEQNLAFIIQSVFSVFKVASEMNQVEKIYCETHQLEKYMFDLGTGESEGEDILETYFEYNCTPEQVLIKNFHLDEYDPKIQAEIISQLIPSNLIVIFRHSDLTGLVRESEFSRVGYFCNKFPIEHGFKLELRPFAKTEGAGLDTLVESRIFQDEIMEERYTKAKYVARPLSPCFLLLISNVSSELASSKFGIQPIKPNPYLPRDFSLKLDKVSEESVPVRLGGALTKYLASNRISLPRAALAHLDRYSNFFYFPTHKLEVPKAAIQLRISFPLNMIPTKQVPFSTNTLKLGSMFALLSYIINSQYLPYMHEVETSGYFTTLNNFSFQNDARLTNTLIFYLEGFTDRIHTVVSKFSEITKVSARNITLSDFNTQKQRLKSHLASSVKFPEFRNTLKSIMKKIYFNQDISYESSLAILESITFQEFANFVNFMLENFKLEGFVFGNLTPLKSARILESFVSTISMDSTGIPASTKASSLRSRLSCFHLLFPGSVLGIFKSLIQPLLMFLWRRELRNSELELVPRHLRSEYYSGNSVDTLENLQVIDLLSLGKGTKIFHYHACKPNFQYSSVVLNVAIGYNSERNVALTKFLNRLISGEFYNEIHKVKQLSYSANVDFSEFFGRIAGINFVVTSPLRSTKILAESVLEFWEEWFSPGTERISRDLFESSRKAYIHFLQDPPNTLSAIVQEFAGEMLNKRYNFKLRQEIIKVLENLSYQEFMDWMKSVYHNSNHLLLLIQSPGWSKNHEIEAIQRFIPKNFTRFNQSDSLFNLENVRTYDQIKIFNVE
ncbi:insulinase-like protease [Cryptosporidium felis]|nr:insulinase-like protease [Cryptosporidium felis]